MIMSSFNQQLVSFHVITEQTSKNNNSKPLITWTYPTIADDLKQFLLSKSSISASNIPFLCLRKNNLWLYCFRCSNSNKKKPPQAVEDIVVLVTRDFDPIKYRPLCECLARTYAATASPVELVRLYLEVYTTGGCAVQQENGPTAAPVLCCDLKRFKKVTNIKGFINQFGAEVVLIYNALLLKRRVLLIHDDIEVMQKEMLAISSLVPTRNLDNYLYPFIETSKELKGLSFYVAGTINTSLVDEHDLYDLYVNLGTREIMVSPQAREIMAMISIHKELARFLISTVKSPDLTESQLISALTSKTDEIVSTLRNMASTTTTSAGNNLQQHNNKSTKMLTIKELKAKNYSKSMENFIFNLAIAENIMIL